MAPKVAGHAKLYPATLRGIVVGVVRVGVFLRVQSGFEKGLGLRVINKLE